MSKRAVELAEANLEQVRQTAAMMLVKAEAALDEARAAAEREPAIPAWVPNIGYNCFPGSHNYLKLAASLEAVRRRVCSYGAIEDMTCDCKFGVGQRMIDGKPVHPQSEQNGCPELREVIAVLLQLEAQS